MHWCTYAASVVYMSTVCKCSPTGQLRIYFMHYIYSNTTQASIHHCHWHCVTNAHTVNTIWCHMQRVDRAVSTDADLCTWNKLCRCNMNKASFESNSYYTQWHTFTHSLIKPSVYCILIMKGMENIRVYMHTILLFIHSMTIALLH